MKLKNIHLSGNEHGQLRANTIYAELWDEEGMCISATLEYILVAIRDRKFQVDGVNVVWEETKRLGCEGIECSTVELGLYN